MKNISYIDLKTFKFSILYTVLPVIITILLFSSIAFAQNDAPGSCIMDQIKQLELKVFNKNFEGSSIIQRIDKLEKKVMGKPQQGSFAERLNNISAKLGINLQTPSIPDNQSVDKTKTDEVPHLEPKEDSNQAGLIMDGQTQLKNDQKTIEKLPDAVTQGETEPQQAASAQEDDKSKKKKKKKKNKNEPQEEPQFDPNAENYYDTLMFVCQEKVIRWKKMPLKVFLPDGNNITYMPEYRKAAIRALDFWKLKTNGIIDYVLVDNPKKANIIVVWQDNFPESEGEGGQTASAVGYNDTRGLAGNLVSTTGMFMPGYFGYAASLLGALVGGFNNTAKIKSVHMRIGTLPAMKLKKDSAVKLIETIAAHEYGHAIGISCHSVNPEDLMYRDMPYDGTLKLPSQRDVATIIELYKHDPDITD